MAYLQAVQDINRWRRNSRTEQYQSHLADLRSERVEHLGAKVDELPCSAFRKLQGRRFGYQQTKQHLQGSLVIDRDQAARFGIQPELIDATLYDALWPAPGDASTSHQLNAYHVILEVPPALQGDPGSLAKLSISSHRSDNQMVPFIPALAHYDTSQVDFLSIQPPREQFPSVTLSIQSGTGRGTGQAVDAINRTSARSTCPEGVVRLLPGLRTGVPGSLRTEPLLILAGAHRRVHHSGNAL